MGRKLVACVATVMMLLSVACSKDVEDACEHLNEICSSKQGFQKLDCSKAKSDYDKASDADKEKSDKIKDCVLDKDTCDQALTCATGS